MYFFQEYLPTMALASIMLFLLLINVSHPDENKEASQSKSNKLQNKLQNKLLIAISQNTLPIFQFHVMVLESLQIGYFGFAINGNVIDSVIGVSLMTVIVLFICLTVILPLKKVPLLKQLIG